MRKSLLIGSLALAAATVAMAETTTLKQGLNGYRGTADTYLAKVNKEKSMNGKAILSLTSFEAANPNEDRILIRFSALNLPQKAKITKATLRLYAFELKVGKPAPVDPVLNVAAVLTDWDEKEANWNEAAKGRPWQLPGAKKTDADISAPIAVVTVPIKDFKPGWIDFDVTASLQKMLAEGKNNGWMIWSESTTQGNNNGTIWFRDWEFPKETDPELVVTWEIALPE